MSPLLKGRNELQPLPAWGGPETLGWLIKEGVPAGLCRVCLRRQDCVRGRGVGEGRAVGLPWSHLPFPSLSLEWQAGGGWVYTRKGKDSTLSMSP